MFSPSSGHLLAHFIMFLHWKSTLKGTSSRFLAHCSTLMVLYHVLSSRGASKRDPLLCFFIEHGCTKGSSSTLVRYESWLRLKKCYDAGGEVQNCSVWTYGYWAYLSIPLWRKRKFVMALFVYVVMCGWVCCKQCVFHRGVCQRWIMYSMWTRERSQSILFKYTVWEPRLKNSTSHTYDLLSGTKCGSLRQLLSMVHCPQCSHGDKVLNRPIVLAMWDVTLMDVPQWIFPDLLWRKLSATLSLHGWHCPFNSVAGWLWKT